MKLSSLGKWAAGFALAALLSGCAGLATWSANNEIEKSQLLEQNAQFQQESGINLVYVKRAMWSMQESLRTRPKIAYFDKLMSNTLVFVYDTAQSEYAKQKHEDGVTYITVNGNFAGYDELEKSLLLAAASSTLAALNNNSANKTALKKIFFDCFRDYDPADMPAIVNSNWFKSQNISLTDDGLLISGS